MFTEENEKRQSCLASQNLAVQTEAEFLENKSTYKYKYIYKYTKQENQLEKKISECSVELMEKNQDDTAILHGCRSLLCHWIAL